MIRVLLLLGAVGENVVDLKLAAGHGQCGPAVLIEFQLDENAGENTDFFAAILFREVQTMETGFAELSAGLLRILALFVALFEVNVVITSLHEFVYLL